MYEKCRLKSMYFDFFCFNLVFSTTKKIHKKCQKCIHFYLIIKIVFFDSKNYICYFFESLNKFFIQGTGIFFQTSTILSFHSFQFWYKNSSTSVLLYSRGSLSNYNQKFELVKYINKCYYIEKSCFQLESIIPWCLYCMIIIHKTNFNSHNA